MQAEGSGLVHYVHNAPAEDHDLKRDYLARLTPHQIIDICLALDIHVPVALKRTIWPLDLKAAIASTQKITPKLEDIPTPIPPKVDPKPQPPDPKSPEPSADVKPPDKQQPTAGPSTQPVPPLQPQPTQVQAYGFSTQPAYPHTPYYQALPPGYTPYAYPAYPPPPNTFPTGTFPQPGHPYSLPPTGYPQRAYYGGPSLPDSSIPVPAPVSEDTDLPSYEDMIVEGLTAVGDPEGMAPKDLFNWMAARYPVQSNFRPSASQALQKAYRRGRFEKGTNGRYRLNANWEGGNSSTRRATRRPQTNNAVPNALHKARMPVLPFTVAPRPPPRQSGATPHSGSAPPAGTATQTQKAPSDGPAPKSAIPSNGVDASVYEAAQNILQTINFGGVSKAADPAVKTEPVTLSLADHARAELQGQLALLAAQLQAFGEEGVS